MKFCCCILPIFNVFKLSLARGFIELFQYRRKHKFSLIIAHPIDIFFRKALLEREKFELLPTRNLHTHVIQLNMQSWRLHTQSNELFSRIKSICAFSNMSEAYRQGKSRSGESAGEDARLRLIDL
jgi:hypothetical protein